jgi:isoquinoline 1-oxidoreductase beta subunit
VQAAAGATLVLAIPRPAWTDEWRASREAASFTPAAFLTIDSTGMVSITGYRSEMGQGIHTAIAMLVAEELEADWRRVRVVPAVADPRVDMATAGSRSVRTQYLPLRTAGAAAREMLLAAAAQRWGVPLAELQASGGAVSHPPSGRRAGYGELVELAATQPVPAAPVLKDPKRFRLVGTRLPRVDTPAKVDGSARFGLDVRVPGLRFAVLVRPPVLGARLDRFDGGAAGRLPGVLQVLPLEGAVAVVAESTWAALEGAKRVAVVWRESPHAGLSSESISRQLRDRSREPGTVARNEGDAMTALATGRRISAEYEVPYLAHATMEPQNCTADVQADRAEVWVPTQAAQRCQEVTSEVTGLPRERVVIHPTYLGGGFGRRGERDFVREAVLLSRAIGAPVQVVWTREDDMRNDFYRPSTFNRFEAAVDGEGRPVAWYHCIAGQSLRSRSGPLPDGLDPSSVEGAANLPYAIPNLRVEYCRLDTPVPIGYWRSVGSSQNAFVTECFVDEVAGLAGVDPFEFRRRHLVDPRARRVLELAAAKAGWGTPLSRGRYRGIAYAACYGSFAAEVAEVSLAGGAVRVHRVVCALDCGQVVNPDTVEAQVEGAVVYGLTAALYGEITLEAGRIRQGNFDSYPLLRLTEMPRIEVHIMPSAEAPGGVGEPGTPPIAPAVANAVFQATGKRVRRLPIRV